jgi:hypothetical protein
MIVEESTMQIITLFSAFGIIIKEQLIALFKRDPRARRNDDEHNRIYGYTGFNDICDISDCSSLDCGGGDGGGGGDCGDGGDCG